MAFRDIVDSQKKNSPNIEFRGEPVEWHINGAAVHRAKEDEGIDIGDVLMDLQRLGEGEINLSTAFDSIVTLFWIGLQEDVSLKEVRQVFTLADLKDSEDMIRDMADAILPEADVTEVESEDDQAKN